MSKIRPAATVILRRDDGKVLLLARHGKSDFFANAWVYPGGSVDAQDRDLSPKHLDVERQTLAARLSMDAKEATAFFVAAIRETFEEAGVLLATRRDGQPLRRKVSDWRQEGEDAFFKMVAQEDLVLQTSALHYFSHWITPTFEKKRFDTIFFLARVDEVRASHDEVETVDSGWFDPAEILSRYEEAQVLLAPPTIRTLQRLNAKSFDTLLRECALLPPKILPMLSQHDGKPALLLPGDPDYVADQEFDVRSVEDGKTRMVLEDDRWRCVAYE